MDTHTNTDTQTAVANIHFAMPHAKYNNTSHCSEENHKICEAKSENLQYEIWHSAPA